MTVQIIDADGSVETLTTTAEHPFYVAERGFIRADQLREGMTLTVSGGDSVSISKIEPSTETIMAYNFAVADFETYYVGESKVWVHNTCVLRSLSDISSLRGASAADVEKLADAKYLESGWTKAPLKDGNGVRYYDGKGNSFQINKGYPDGKEMHGGPYVKSTQGNKIERVPLEGNPDL